MHPRPWRRAGFGFIHDANDRHVYQIDGPADEAKDLADFIVSCVNAAAIKAPLRPVTRDILADRLFDAVLDSGGDVAFNTLKVADALLAKFRVTEKSP